MEYKGLSRRRRIMDSRIWLHHPPGHQAGNHYCAKQQSQQSLSPTNPIHTPELFPLSLFKTKTQHSLFLESCAAKKTYPSEKGSIMLTDRSIGKTDNLLQHLSTPLFDKRLQFCIKKLQINNCKPYRWVCQALCVSFQGVFKVAVFKVFSEAMLSAMISAVTLSCGLSLILPSR